MRIAIVSDIHGNLTAFEAVLRDLRHAAPDLVLHGGDLADSGSSPAEIVDRIRDLGWEGVAGNTDEMLFSPESLTEFAARSPQLGVLFAAIGEMAVAARAALGEARLAWLRSLPRVQLHGPIALVHASPANLWVAPALEIGDDELGSTYGPLCRLVAVYAHIHRSFVRRVPRVSNVPDRAATALTVANTGSVSLSYDGDSRASYLLLDETEATIRRVEYDVERECRLLADSGLPHADWVAGMLRTGRFKMP
jgi:predicted phosphodiesterase